MLMPNKRLELATPAADGSRMFVVTEASRHSSGFSVMRAAARMLGAIALPDRRLKLAACIDSPPLLFLNLADQSGAFRR